jgi:hypothetical protein
MQCSYHAHFVIKNDSSKELYKRQRNLVNNKKKQAKEKFYANVNDNLSDLKSVNSKLYYKTINRIEPYFVITPNSYLPFWNT